jgi:acyl carrier protein
VPIGVSGEIYIGGANVARGYLDRAHLTAERFLADPFNADPTARLYRTGDLGRWKADGSIEYLGRNDHQVKIRGFRIELGEIEAQLARHEEVKEAVVLARGDVTGERRLVAYVVSDETVSSQEELKLRLILKLREHLKGLVPEYMVPSAWVVLPRLPLNPNGKLDRRALPNPQGRSEVLGQYVSPSTETEKALARIWTEVLQVDRVGLDDNFFELGGHSLHGLKLIAKVSQRFGVRLSVVAVFRYPTVQLMAKALESMKAPEGMQREEGVV